MADRGAQVNPSASEPNEPNESTSSAGSALLSSIRHRALPHMWQVLLDHGADIEQGDGEMTPVRLP